MKTNITIQKGIFQIRYKSNLIFYENLYSKKKIFDYFPHWQTDRLKINLRDFENQHSLTLKHDSVTYESDSFKKSNLDDVVNLIEQNLEEFTNGELINRFGLRFFCLVPLKINFQELVEILNVKLFSTDFFQSIGGNPDDNSCTITSNYNNLKYRLMIGPIRNIEIPNFIQYNVENHIDVNSFDKYSRLSRIMDNYPETALFMDLDMFKQEQLDNLSVKQFYNSSFDGYNKITSDIVKYIFKDKI